MTEQVVNENDAPPSESTAEVLPPPPEQTPASAEMPDDPLAPADEYIEPPAAPELTEAPPEADSTVEPTPAEADELATAIAQSGELVSEEPGLDDIAPGTAAAPEPVAGEDFASFEYDAVASTVSWWPFIIYDLVWLAFAGAMIWQFNQLPVGVAVFDGELYPISVLVGIVLTIAGPLLILATWFASFGKPDARKGQLFISALSKGAIATTVGVTLWWVAILILDQLRLGALV